MKNNWSEIQIQLELRELPEEKMPKLLHECIVDLHNLERKLSDTLQDINSLHNKHCTTKEIRHARTKSESRS